jgi:hypothetical protein
MDSTTIETQSPRVGASAPKRRSPGSGPGADGITETSDDFRPLAREGPGVGQVREGGEVAS